MAKPKRFRKEFGPWPRGLDERPPLTLDDKALPVCNNMRVVWPSAAVALRPGTQRIITTGSEVPGTIRNGTTFPIAGTPRHIVVSSNGNLYYSNVGLLSGQTMSTPGGAPFSVTNVPQFAAFYDNTGAQVLYIADGAGKVSKFSTVAALTARVAATTPATVYRIAVYNERLFGISGSDSTLYFSGLGNGDSLGDTTNGGGSIIIRPVNGDKLIGLLAIGQTLLLFFESSIGRFTGWSQDDIDVSAGTRGLSTAVGLLSVNFMPVAAENNRGFFFGNDSEMYEATEAGIVQLSGALSSYRRRRSSAGIVVAGQIGVWPAKGEVWFATTAGAYIYNYRFPCWAGFWQDANTYGSETVLTLTPSFWNYISGGIEKIFVGSNAGNIVLGDSAGIPSSGQRCFGKDYVAADGTGGNAISGIVFFRPCPSGIGGDLSTRFNHLYLSVTDIVLTANAYEAIGNVFRTGAAAAGSMTTLSNIGTIAGSWNTNTTGIPEYVIVRFAGQSQGNQISLGAIFDASGSAITEAGELEVVKAVVEGFRYDTRTDPGPSL